MELEIEVAELRICQLCLQPIDPRDTSDYYWEDASVVGGRVLRLMRVCRGCASRLLKQGERIVGVTR